MERRLSVGVLNSHLLCVLCSGYLIDATALTECLHRFCKSCILKYLKENRFCPICDTPIPDDRNCSYLKPDIIVQSLVYKLVPGLYKKEITARKKFYTEQSIEPPAGESYGLPAERYFSQGDGISMSLEHYQSEKSAENVAKDNDSGDWKMYLQCPAALSIRLLKRFLRVKFDLSSDKAIDIIYSDECIKNTFSIMDIVYTFKWDRTAPLRLAYMIRNKKQKTVTESRNKVQREATHLPIQSTKSTATNIDHQRQQQSEYLGHLNLNPKGHPRSNGPVEPTEKQKETKDEESDSATSELRIASEKETADASSDEEYHPKNIKKLGKRKKHEIKKGYLQKRRKSDSFAEVMKKNDIDRKNRRKSLFDNVQQNSDDGETLKNEALKKVFTNKEKSESNEFRRRDPSLRKKKRKKSKHHEGETKKRKLENLSTPAILSIGKDALKLKVKLNSAKVHQDVYKDDDNRVDKERLSHLRAVRHKHIIHNNNNNNNNNSHNHNNNTKSDYLSTTPSITICKIGVNDQNIVKTSLVESKPSLEIMLVQKTKDDGAKNNDAGVLDLSEKPKILDLSEKSTRPKENSVEKSPNKSTHQSILQIAETLVNRKLSPPHETKVNDSMMRDLKTLSDAAVSRIANKIPPKSPPKIEDSGLKIPIFPRERSNQVPPVPNLHLICPRGRGRPLGSSTPRLPIVFKPGQNQNIRQIPDPSVVLNRQNNVLHSYRPDSSTSPGKSKLDSIPPLHSIKAKMPQILDRKDNGTNLKMPVNSGMKSPNVVSSTSSVKINSSINNVRRLDIESVAAGLTARANALIDAK